MGKKDELNLSKEYKYDFKDNIDSIESTGKGLSREVVEAISKAKHEPEWMLEFRLKSYDLFNKIDFPKFGPDTTKLDFNSYTYFTRYVNGEKQSWDNVPETIKNTFNKLGIPEAEQKYLSGAATQYESEMVYHKMKEQFDKLGIIFTDTDTALQEYPDLFKKYFGKLVPIDSNKFSALNCAVWSGGTFIYVPKGVQVPTPVQAYFRLNAENSGQFERTLIIVDEDAHLDYVEGCTAPQYSSDSLHAAVVEVNVLDNAYCRYTTIQNWSDNVYSLETKRAVAGKHATMEWVDGNLGAKVTMKYPSVYLNGEGARGTMLSIAVAHHGIHQDSGAGMFHNAPNTSSSIVSKSIAKGGGSTDYRGSVKFSKKSDGSKAHVECDTIIMDDMSSSDTIPTNAIENSNVAMEHEATVSKISEDQLYYLESRGIPERKATEMIIMGFVEPFTKQLPMEYAVELNRLISFQMEGAIG